MTAVRMQIPMKIAVSQCTQREPRPNRSISSPVSSGATVSGVLIETPPVRLAHEPVDVIAAVLPVARDNDVGHLDAGEPVDDLVAVHRRDVEPDRPTMVVGDVA